MQLVKSLLLQQPLLLLGSLQLTLLVDVARQGVSIAPHPLPSVARLRVLEVGCSPHALAAQPHTTHLPFTSNELGYACSFPTPTDQHSCLSVHLWKGTQPNNAVTEELTARVPH